MNAELRPNKVKNEKKLWQNWNKFWDKRWTKLRLKYVWQKRHWEIMCAYLGVEKQLEHMSDKS